MIRKEGAGVRMGLMGEEGLCTGRQIIYRNNWVIWLIKIVFKKYIYTSYTTTFFRHNLMLCHCDCVGVHVCVCHYDHITQFVITSMFRCFSVTGKSSRIYKFIFFEKDIVLRKLFNTICWHFSKGVGGGC